MIFLVKNTPSVIALKIIITHPTVYPSLHIFFSYGGFIGAPVYYHWYQKLDIYFSRQTHLLTRVIVGRKLLLDMFLVTPVMTGVFYIGWYTGRVGNALYRSHMLLME